MQWKSAVGVGFYSLLFQTFCEVGGIMIKQVCPPDETHKSCSFYNENACWADENRHDRVKVSPKRLAHCKSGCYCKKGYVRDFPGGGCILAAGCRSHKISSMLEGLPGNTGLYGTE